MHTFRTSECDTFVAVSLCRLAQIRALRKKCVAIVNDALENTHIEPNILQTPDSRNMSDEVGRGDG